MIRYTLVGSDNSVSTATYLVQTNSQGDVVALYTKAGSLYASYEYDAWGNTLSITDASGNPITAWYNIANANPIRYRGYYFDADLNLYYLQSRYYDSEIGRFINSDNVTDPGAGLLGYNTFIYCANNPVNAADPSGHGLIWDKIKGFLGIESYSKSSLRKQTKIKGSGVFAEYASGTQTDVTLRTKTDKKIWVYSETTCEDDNITGGIGIATNSCSCCKYSMRSGRLIICLSENI